MANEIRNSAVRVRMAPSPTGHLHVGGLRTAFFNWLFARHHNGFFLIRIEDTDLERSREEYTASVLQSFAWVGIESDEPIVVQSSRIERHKEVVHQLLAAGKAYKCFCTPSELQERIGTSAAQEGGYARYDRFCCDIARLPKDYAHRPYTVRYKTPDDVTEVSFNDLIHGHISFGRDQFDDFIIMRSDGTPMYNLGVVVDDADMRITHIIRGEEHLSNTPKQIMLYQACNFTIPLFGHLPLILGPDGNKLSKRDAATAVLDYKMNGFLADALCNYLVRLGWSHGDQEIFTREQLISYFSLDHVGKKGAIFDSKKLEWLNSMYIRQLSAAQALNLIERDVDPKIKHRFSGWSQATLEQALGLYKDRVKTLKELIDEVETIYKSPVSFNSVELAPWSTQITKERLEKIKESLLEQKDFSAQALTTLIKSKATELGAALPQVAKPLRIALTGKSESPGIFELLALLGKNESMMRLTFFIGEISP